MATRHALRFNGAPHTEAGALIYTDPKITKGAGRALCACGELSEDLANGSARRAWFKQHAAAAAAPAPVAAEAPAAPAKPKRAPKAKKAPAAPQKPAQPSTAAELDQLLEDAAAAYYVSVPFLKEVADYYWRFMGREGGHTMVSMHFPGVTYTARSSARTVTLSGPDEAQVKRAGAALRKMWEDGYAALKPFMETDKEYLNRPAAGVPRRAEAFRIKGRFLLRFCAEYSPADS